MLNNLKPRDKSILLVLLVVALSFASYWFLYRPMGESLEENQAELDLLKRTIRVESRKLEERKVLEARYQSLLKELERSQGNYLELEKELDKVIYLNDLSLDTDVTLVSIRPDRVRTTDIYLEVPYRLEMVGDYNNILDYIEGIGELEYITRLNTLRFRAEPLPNNEVKVNLDLSSFSLDTMEGGGR